MFKKMKTRVLYEIGHFKSMGLYEAGRLAMDRAVQRLCLSRFRTAMRPSLHQLHQISQSTYMSTASLIEHAFSAALPSHLKEIENEYKELEIELASRYEKMAEELNYPEWYAIERETSFLLYAVCRLTKPENVLETGVADGRSSFFWLHAIKKNGKGSLHSIDVSDDVGQLIEFEERKWWNLHILKAPQRASFHQVLDSISPLDVFFHDSDHTYGWQIFEYRAAFKNISPGGVFLSDDVDHNMAFYDFCKANNHQPFLLMDTRKITGILLPGQ